MYGISSSAKKRIHEFVDDFFDNVSTGLLGQLPQYRDKKNIIITSKPNLTLADLFLKSLGSKPLPKEREALKNLLSTTEEYISSLRSKTKAQIVESVDSYVKERALKNERASTVEIKNRINEVLNKSKAHLKTIAESETTKASNMGKALQIGKVAASQGVQDPSVFFVVLRDNKTCHHCISAHLMPDLITPRVYKLSEVKFSYLKKEERGNSVSITGQHANCRCRLTFLAPNFGFKAGQVAWIGEGHDEYKTQRS